MSTNLLCEIHVFTDEQLKEHDLNIAHAVHQATVKHVARKMIKMNSGQQLKSMTNDCKSLRFSDEKLERIVQIILDDE